MKRNRNLAHRLAGFKALTESDQHQGYFLEEFDGSFRTWGELSAERKLDSIARNAVYYDVPFEPFAAAVQEVLKDLPPAAREEAALRLVFRSVQEMHGLESLFPDDGRTESPPPLIERFQELLGKTSLAELKAEGQQKQQARPQVQDKGRER